MEVDRWLPMERVLTTPFGESGYFDPKRRGYIVQLGAECAVKHLVKPDHGLAIMVPVPNDPSDPELFVSLVDSDCLAWLKNLPLYIAKEVKADG